MSEPYLLLWLEAPLQSWGHDSKFGRRDSLDFPTKSGVLGLLCCALGAAGEQREWLETWANRDMAVQAFVPADKVGKPMSPEPLLRDFHMVGSGYKRGVVSSKDPEYDPWESLLIPLSADKKNKKTALTYRFYVQDMAYAVALQAPQAELEYLQQALQNPVWDLYLGRKNCVPTDFIERGIFASKEAAFSKAQELALEKNRALSFSVQQGEHDGEQLTLNDVPLQFGTQKLYRDRRVTVIKES